MTQETYSQRLGIRVCKHPVYPVLEKYVAQAVDVWSSLRVDCCIYNSKFKFEYSIVMVGTVMQCTGLTIYLIRLGKREGSISFTSCTVLTII
jgi:hypothetical protein